MMLSRQDTINLILLAIFILPFVIVIRQLFIEDSRDIQKESREKNKEK